MRVFSKLTALGILLSLAVTFSSSSSADTQKAKKDRLSGNVRTVDKDKTEVTLRRGTADSTSNGGRWSADSPNAAKRGSPRPNRSSLNSGPLPSDVVRVKRNQ